jgi:hypothetical protein
MLQMCNRVVMEVTMHDDDIAPSLRAKEWHSCPILMFSRAILGWKARSIQQEPQSSVRHGMTWCRSVPLENRRPVAVHRRCHWMDLSFWVKVIQITTDYIVSWLPLQHVHPSSALWILYCGRHNLLNLRLYIRKYPGAHRGIQTLNPSSCASGIEPHVALPDRLQAKLVCE